MAGGIASSSLSKENHNNMALNKKVLEVGNKEGEKQVEASEVQKNTINKCEEKQQEDKRVDDLAVILKEIPDSRNKEEMCGLNLKQKEQISEAVPTKEVQFLGGLMLIESAEK